MAKFIFLYSGGKKPESETEQKKVMKAWMDWFADLGDALVDPGNPFSPPAKNIASDRTVNEIPMESMLYGYLFLTAESMDQAVEMGKGCPSLDDGTEVSVYQVHEMM